MRVGGPGHGIWLEGQQAGLRLQVGQIVRATVEGVEGNSAWLRLAGQLLRARVFTPLQPGERLLLAVESTGETPHLRLLASLPVGGTSPATPGGTGPATPTPATPGGTGQPPGAGGALPAAGNATPAATADGIPVLILRTLVAYRLPLEASLVDRLTRLVRAWPHGPDREQVASAAAWLVKTGRPLTPEAVARLLQQAAGPEGWSLQGRLEQLAAALAAVGSTGRPEEAAPPERQALLELARALRAWTAAPGQEGPATIQALLAEVRRQLAAYTRRNKAGLPAAQSALQEVEGFLEALRQQGGGPGPGPAGSGEWLVYPLPLPWPGQEDPREVLLLYRREPRPPEESAGSSEEVQIQLQTPHLGLLTVHLRQLAGTVTIRVLAEEPAATAALEQALPQLAAALAARGVQVGGLAANTGSLPLPPLLRSPQPALPPGLDQKA